MVWPMVAAAAIQAGAGYLSGRSARKTGRNLNAIAEAQSDEQRARAGDLSQGITAAGQRWGGNYAFTPVTSRNAFGSAGMDQYGNVETGISPMLQQWADQYGTLADSEYSQLQGLDRNAMAAGRISQLNELQRPGDMEAQTSMMDQLRRRGLMGFTKTDQRTGGQANPYATAFESARSTRGLQQAYDATGWVEQNIGNRMQRMSQLRGAQQGVYGLADTNLQPMQQAYSNFRNARVDQARFGYQNEMQAYEQMLNQRYAAPEYWQNSMQAAGAAGQAQQGMISGVARGATNLFNNWQIPQATQSPAPIENRTMPKPSGMFGGTYGYASEDLYGTGMGGSIYPVR